MTHWVAPGPVVTVPGEQASQIGLGFALLPPDEKLLFEQGSHLVLVLDRRP